jgi:hypothetical protein
MGKRPHTIFDNLTSDTESFFRGWHDEVQPVERFHEDARGVRKRGQSRKSAAKWCDGGGRISVEPCLSLRRGSVQKVSRARRSLAPPRLANTAFHGISRSRFSVSAFQRFAISAFRRGIPTSSVRGSESGRGAVASCARRRRPGHTRPFPLPDNPRCRATRRGRRAGGGRNDPPRR